MPSKKKSTKASSEQKQSSGKQKSSGQSEKFTQDMKKILQKGNQSKILIKEAKGSFVYLSVPVTIAVIVTIILPPITLLLVLFALFGLIKLEYQKD